MMDESEDNMSWLGDPKVTLVSDDGYQFLCHQIILGIYDKSLKSILAANKMAEYVLIFQSTNNIELKEYIDTVYSSISKLIQKYTENIDQIPQENSNNINTYKENSTTMNHEMKDDEKNSTPNQNIPSTIDAKNSKVKEGANKELDIKLEYKCELCDFSAFRKSSILRHFKSVHDGKKYDCDECGKSVRYLKQHKNRRHSKNQKSVHEGKKYDCDECGKSVRYLKDHKNRRHSENTKTLNCKICDKSFHYKQNLKVHIKRNHDKKIFNCDQCNFSASLNSFLKQHLLIHGDPTIKCEDCEYKTTRKSCLNRHRKIQHNQEIFSCSKCSYVCKTGTALSDHNRKKHDETFQRLKCDQCTYSTDRKDSLQKHIEGLHDNVGFPCYICEYQATRKQYLANHLQRVHKQY